MKIFLEKASEFSQVPLEENNIAIIIEKTKKDVEAILQLPSLLSLPTEKGYPEYNAALKYLVQGIDKSGVDKKLIWDILFGWVLVKNIGMISEKEGFTQQSREWLDEWLLGKVLADTYRSLKIEETQILYAAGVVKFMISQTEWSDALFTIKRSESTVLDSWLVDPDIQQFLKINRYDEILWYNKEAFEQFLFWMTAIILVNEIAEFGAQAAQSSPKLVSGIKFIQSLSKATEKSGYQVNKLVQIVKKSKTTRE
jgi:hypothetical protein